jgi:acetyl esterase/lipase
MRQSAISRFLFLTTIAMVVAWPSPPLCQAQPKDGAALLSAPVLDPVLGITTVPLWAGKPPAASGASDEPLPTLTVFAPQPGKANGTAVVIAPGGGYIRLASNLEGRQVADWFTARGVMAFVLRYRLGKRNLYPVPLQDAQRALRVVRAYGAAQGVALKRVGIMGFSAGGHLAAMASVEFDDGNPAAADVVEQVSDRPDFVVLGYPWLNAMQLRDPKVLNYCGLMGNLPADQCAALEKQFTPSLRVTVNTPPTFIYGTTDDATVPVSALIDYYSALHAAGVPTELHLFAHGKHGSGLGSGEPALDAWPTLLEQWLRDQGYLTPVQAAPSPGHASQ